MNVCVTYEKVLAVQLENVIGHKSGHKITAPSIAGGMSYINSSLICVDNGRDVRMLSYRLNGVLSSTNESSPDDDLGPSPTSRCNGWPSTTPMDSD